MVIGSKIINYVILLTRILSLLQSKFELNSTSHENYFDGPKILYTGLLKYKSQPLVTTCLIIISAGPTTLMIVSLLVQD